MPSLPDNVIGSVELSRSSKLIFSVRPWKGWQLAHVRKFVATSKYEGPTKAGLALAGEVPLGVIAALQRLQAEVPGADAREFARVSKRGEVDIVISTLPPDDTKTLASVDVREFIDTADYTGPTKKGIRFPWEKLAEVITPMQTQAQRLGTSEKSRPTLSPDAAPKRVEQADEVGREVPTSRDAILAGMLPKGPKRFPEDFLNSPVTRSKTLELTATALAGVRKRCGKRVSAGAVGCRSGMRHAGTRRSARASARFREPQSPG